MRRGLVLAVVLMAHAGCAAPTEGAGAAVAEPPSDAREPYDLVLAFKRGSPVPGGPCVRPTSCEVPLVYADTETTTTTIHELEGWRVETHAEWNGSDPLRVWFREGSGTIVAEAEGTSPLAVPLDESTIAVEVEYVFEAAPTVGAVATALDVRGILRFTPAPPP